MYAHQLAMYASGFQSPMVVPNMGQMGSPPPTLPVVATAAAASSSNMDTEQGRRSMGAPIPEGCWT